MAKKVKDSGAFFDLPFIYEFVSCKLRPRMFCDFSFAPPRCHDHDVFIAEIVIEDQVQQDWHWYDFSSCWKPDEGSTSSSLSSFMIHLSYQLSTFNSSTFNQERILKR